MPSNKNNFFSKLSKSINLNFEKNKKSKDDFEVPNSNYKKIKKNILSDIDKNKLKIKSKDTSDLLPTAKELIKKAKSFEKINVFKLKNDDIIKLAKEFQHFFDDSKILFKDDTKMFQKIDIVSKLVDILKNPDNIGKSEVIRAAKILKNAELI